MANIPQLCSALSKDRRVLSSAGVDASVLGKGRNAKCRQNKALSEFPTLRSANPFGAMMMMMAVAITTHARKQRMVSLLSGYSIHSDMRETERGDVCN